jgi:hypothetical protein
MKVAHRFLTICDVARLDGKVTPEAVRYWNRTGKLRAVRTASGIRLFERGDVERFLKARRQAAEQADREEGAQADSGANNPIKDNGRPDPAATVRTRKDDDDANAEYHTSS